MKVRFVKEICWQPVFPDEESRRGRPAIAKGSPRKGVEIMSERLKGKVAVVTGASKGIGAAIARPLAAEGAAVAVNYSSSKEEANRVVADIAGKGGRAIAIQADLAKEADVRRLFAQAREALGRIDILVNNAGVYEFAPLENLTADHF